MIIAGYFCVIHCKSEQINTFKQLQKVNEQYPHHGTIWDKVQTSESATVFALD